MVKAKRGRGRGRPRLVRKEADIPEATLPVEEALSPEPDLPEEDEEVKPEVLLTDDEDTEDLNQRRSQVFQKIKLSYKARFFPLKYSTYENAYYSMKIVKTIQTVELDRFNHLHTIL